MKKNKILIVDDEPGICDVLANYFKERNHITYTAQNGAEALKIIEEKIPDLIILDILMPVMNGLKVLEKIRTNSSYSKIPVIMLTAKNSPADVKKGIDLGTEFYLTKPFELENVDKFVRFILED